MRDRDDFSDTIPTGPMPLVSSASRPSSRSHVLGSAGAMRLAPGALSPIAAHCATEVGIPSDEPAPAAPRIPRQRHLPGAGAIVVPIVVLAAICAVALGWHLFSR